MRTLSPTTFGVLSGVAVLSPTGSGHFSELATKKRFTALSPGFSYSKQTLKSFNRGKPVYLPRPVASRRAKPFLWSAVSYIAVSSGVSVRRTEDAPARLLRGGRLVRPMGLMPVAV